jgi:SAM-dependent methyltransferase
MTQAARPAELSPEAARTWFDRWEAQQQAYLPGREERFGMLIEALRLGTGRDDPLVLDLGCGPGSLAARILDRLPRATVIGIDADPVLLALARSIWPGRSGLRFAAADLRVPGWSAALGVDPVDAAVSTTALHWLSVAQLTALYAELAGLLRPGGLLLNGDHLEEDESGSPVLARLGRELAELAEPGQPPPGGGESWDEWWRAVAADPALAGLAAERDRLHLESGHHESPSMLFATHVAALRAAGFTEIGTLWQRGSNRLLCAVKGSEPGG